MERGPPPSGRDHIDLPISFHHTPPTLTAARTLASIKTAMADVPDPDADDWVVLNYDNPADSSDDDAGVRSLSSGYNTPDDEHLAVSSARRSRSPSLDPVAEDDAEGQYADAEAEVVPQPQPPAPKPLSGLFHHAPLDGAVTYSTFYPADPAARMDIIPDPSFSASADEGFTVLASNGGLVCLRANASGNYIVANPFTNRRVHLPRHRCDHFANGDPAVVIAFDNVETCCEDHRGHYHVVVAFPLGQGVYTFEVFSSRTWKWTVAEDVAAVEQVLPLSGVGALGRANWRTTLGYILSYDPKEGTHRLIPAPEQVLDFSNWEIGEMDGTLSVTCMDDPVNQVHVLKLPMGHRHGDDIIINWIMAGHFEGGRLRNRHHIQLLRSQGPAEVVMWDPTVEAVYAMDLEGRATRSIGPLSGRQYYPDFIPFISSSTGISSIEAGNECELLAADAEA